MRYYLLGADAEHHVAIGPQDPTLWDFFLDRFDDPVRFERWGPIEVQIITDHVTDPRELLGPGDIVNFNLTPICLFSDRAKSSLAELLEAYGELLPVRGLDQTFYLYHVTTVLEALDESKSVLERFSSGRIMRVIKYVLKDDVVANHDVFRISGDKWKIVVSEHFVERIRKSGLEGFIFTDI